MMILFMALFRDIHISFYLLLFTLTFLYCSFLETHKVSLSTPFGYAYSMEGEGDPVVYQHTHFHTATVCVPGGGSHSRAKEHGESWPLPKCK
jgi:hypothetical protein